VVLPRVMLLITALVLILGATLTPIAGETQYLPPWCLLCSDLATLDLIQNVFLFAPLGLALSSLGVPERRALAAGLALTLFVESLQFLAIPGRDASVGDIITNFVGTWLGFHLALRWRQLLFAGPETARRLATGYGALWVLVMAATAIAMQPSVPDYVYWSQWTPVRSGTTPFPGRLLDARLGGRTIPGGTRVESDTLRQALRAADSHFEVDVIPGYAPRRRALIARVANPIGVAISTAQLRRTFECQRRLVAASMRLRVPSLLLAGAFPSSPLGSARETHRFGCNWDHGHLVASRVTPDSLTSRVALSLGEGWLLLTPVPVPFGGIALAGSAVWIALLGVPAGYWLARARLGGRHIAAGVTRPAMAWGAVTAAGFSLIPVMVGIPLPPVAEWLTSIGGAIAGAWIASAAERRTARQQIPQRGPTIDGAVASKR
jgi:hypothetical protein